MLGTKIATIYALFIGEKFGLNDLPCEHFAILAACALRNSKNEPVQNNCSAC